MVRQVLGRMCAGLVLFLAAAAACGGSAGDPIGAPNGASSSGTSGSDEPRPPSCGDVACVACPTNTREVPDGCCPRCEPIGDQCGGGPDSCANKPACSDGFERFEYATGCCDCRRTQCADVSCEPFRGCPPGERVDLAGCCPTCVKETSCNEGAAPCNRFKCPTGFKPIGRVLDGEGCCSTCEPDPTYCDGAQKAFDQWLERRLAQKGTLECEVTEDCEMVDLTNACKPDCGHAVAKKAKAQLVTDVAEYGTKHCKDCPKLPTGCPAVVLQATCFEKRCRLAPH